VMFVFWFFFQPPNNGRQGRIARLYRPGGRRVLVTIYRPSAYITTMISSLPSLSADSNTYFVFRRQSLRNRSWNQPD